MIMMMLMAAATIVIVVMMILMPLVVMIVIMVVMMLMVMLMVMVVMMLMVMLMVMVVMVLLPGGMMMAAFRTDLFFLHQFHNKIIFLLHGCQNLRSGNLIPGCGHDGRLIISLPDHRNNLIQFLIRYLLRSAQDNGPGTLDLIVIELTEILHEHFAFHGICNCRVGGKLHVTLLCNLQHCLHNIRQLAHTGGLNDNTVRSKLLQYILQCRPEIPHQRAANTARIHLRDLNTGIL